MSSGEEEAGVTPERERRRLEMEEDTPPLPAPRKPQDTQPRVTWGLDPSPEEEVLVEDTPARLRTRLNALQVELEFTKMERDALATPAGGGRRSQGARMSGFSNMSLQEHGVRAKLERPPKFLGGYAELQNVTHWIAEMEEYLTACGCGRDQFCSFAKSYMGPTVKDWMAARFPRSKVPPTWEELTKALLDRFLAADHEELLEIKLERARQGKRDYNTYIEYFQVLDAAIITSNLMISEIRKVRRFIKGLTVERDRYSLLEKRPTTLDQCYTALLAVKQAKEQSGLNPPSSTGYRPQTYPDQKRHASPMKRSLNRLEGREKDQARKEGRCLNCGKAGHWIKECPDMKKTFKKMVAQELKKQANKGVRRQPKKFKQLTTGTSEEEDSSEEQETRKGEGSSDMSEDETREERGKVDSEEEGNDSPGSQG